MLNSKTVARRYEKGVCMSKYEVKTEKGYDFHECSSAMQKSIRRGDEDGALFWATELDKSGFGEYVFKRLKIIASEDIGLGSPTYVAMLNSLYNSWRSQRSKKDEKHKPERLYLVHAVILAARAKKSRIVDHACCVYYSNNDDLRPVPDYALDKHTRRGKMKGRGFDHFFSEASKLNNAADLLDSYAARAKEIMCRPKPSVIELEE
jgi:replication-associated recombination protein RarA